MDLQLQANLDDIEGSYDEAINYQYMIVATVYVNIDIPRHKACDCASYYYLSLRTLDDR